ncbi:hypothetical protein BGX28_008042 [Mortierella sp. GBA30]|nr:hypothetical protein BGX28_008042 [Mortierella sp. GBA30]
MNINSNEHQLHEKVETHEMNMYKKRHDADIDMLSEPEEEEYDRYKDNPELLGVSKTKTSRLFSFDWASGFVSPFRPTPQDILSNLFQQVEFSSPGKDTLLDLGCGDGLVLIQALKTFPRSQLSRVIGVDLDLPLLETCRNQVLEIKQDDKDRHEILPRLELYHGDLTAKDDLLTAVLQPDVPQAKDKAISLSSSTSTKTATMTMRRVLQASSHLFVYLLPEALAKLAPLLLDAIENEQKVVLSMRWEIPELQKYLVHGGADHQYYIYEAN